MKIGLSHRAWEGVCQFAKPHRGRRLADVKTPTDATGTHERRAPSRRTGAFPHVPGDTSSLLLGQGQKGDLYFLLVPTLCVGTHVCNALRRSVGERQGRDAERPTWVPTQSVGRGKCLTLARALPRITFASLKKGRTTFSCSIFGRRRFPCAPPIHAGPTVPPLRNWRAAMSSPSFWAVRILALSASRWTPWTVGQICTVWGGGRILLDELRC